MRNRFQHQPPRLERGQVRRERRQPGGDQIGVHKIGTICIGRQELAGKGRFPRTVRAGDDDDALVKVGGAQGVIFGRGDGSIIIKYFLLGENYCDAAHINLLTRGLNEI